MIPTNDVIVKALEMNPDLCPKILTKVYNESFKSIGEILAEGNRPGVTLTNLVSFNLSAGKLKYKALKLIQLIITEDLGKLKKNFYICTVEEARIMLTETIRIYKMRKLYDKQNILSKKRKS